MLLIITILGDLEAMLLAAGFTQVVPASEAQPGDVVVHNPGPNGHALIYAGNNTYWDQTSAVYGKNPPSLSVTTRDPGYLSESLVFRAP